MVADNSRKPKISFAATYASSAFAACFAELCTIPFDTAKVRLQLQRVAVVGGDVMALPKYRGMVGTVATVAREEGLFSLWRGIAAGLHRQCVYGGLRISLYEPIKTLYVGNDFVGDVPLYKKIAAGLTTERVSNMANSRSLFFKGEALGSTFLKVRSLRVLNLYKADIDKLPSSIGKLTHLRNLNVMETKVKSFPESIGKLFYLETFKMPYHVEEFPKISANMINLRHVYFGKHAKVPVGILGRLTNLRSLPFLKVGKETGPRIEELGGLNHLRDALSIYNLELVSVPSGLAMASPYVFTRLLSLSIGPFWKELDSFPAFQVLPQPESLEIYPFSAK